ncbi:MAG: DUF885 domain-containing protein [Acidimicrobiia bacterium]
MATVHEISDRYVERWAALDPIEATALGVTGHDGAMTDYSPDGIKERAEHDRTTLRELAGASTADPRDRTAVDVMIERIELALELTAAGERLRELRIIGSPVSEVRATFDVMQKETEHDWELVVARLGVVPPGLAGFEASLEAGTAHGVMASRRQAVECAKQAETWGGLREGVPPYFLTLVDAFDAAGIPSRLLRDHLEERARRATAAYAALARYLREDYAPKAPERDAVGAERYALFARVFTGTHLDLVETYEWGWDELHRIEHAMRKVADRILPGEPLAAVIEHLETDPRRAISGVDAFRNWLQELTDRTIAELDGTHFDIAEPLHRCEAMIAPPGGAAAMYYTPPSEDFTRPGRTWYPTLGRTRFPLWGEVSTAYHEGVPGHHLQIAHTTYLRDRLTRFQRHLAHCSGYIEGWALYAERLMGELGYLENPDYELGMLRAQAMRAVRVIVDIGMHLELPIPESEHYHPGERWTPELALPFVIARSHMPADFMASEVDRYLGWPGQAISYKVGERVWLATREEARARAGASFDLKAFHMAALDLGPMGLAQLPRELARLQLKR